MPPATAPFEPAPRDAPVQGEAHPFVYRAVRLACDEVRHQRDPVVGTGALLLGLLREEEGGAGRVLRGSGLEPEALRRAARGLARRQALPFASPRREGRV